MQGEKEKIELETMKTVEKALYDQIHEEIKNSDQMQMLHDYIRYLIFKAGVKEEVKGWSINIEIEKK